MRLPAEHKPRAIHVRTLRAPPTDRPRWRRSRSVLAGNASRKARVTTPVPEAVSNTLGVVAIMAKLRVASTIVDLIHDNVRAANPSDERMSLIVPTRPGRKLVRRTGRVHHTQHLSRERITND